MTATFTAMCQRRTLQLVWFAEIGDLDVSDSPLDLGKPFHPILAGIQGLDFGLDAFVPATVPTASVTLILERRALAALDVYPGDILTRLQNASLLNATVKLYVAHLDMANSWSAGVYTGPRLVFDGRVDNVDLTNDTGVAVYCRNDILLEDLGARTARTFNPSIPDVSREAIVPLIAGRVGWDREYLMERLGAFTSGDGEFWRLCLARYATPAHIISLDPETVQCSTGEIRYGTLNDAGLFAKYDEQRTPFRVAFESGDIDDGGIIVPTTSLGDASGSSDDWALTYSFNPARDIIQAASSYDRAERALTDNFDEFCLYTMTGSVQQLRVGGAFIDLPLGSGDVLTDASHLPYVIAVIELSHAHTVRLGIENVLNYDWSLSAGHHVVTSQLDSTWADNISQGWGEASDDFINIDVQNPTAGHTMKIRYIGVYYETPVKFKQLFRRNAWSRTGTVERDQWHEPAKFYFGHLGGQTSSDATPNDSAIRDFLIEGSAWSNEPLGTGDVVTGAGQLGSFDDLESDLEGAVSRYPICVVSYEEGETLRAALERTAQDLFIWLRRFSGLGGSKFGAATRKASPSTTGAARLYPHMVDLAGIDFGASPSGLVRNAVYLHFGYDYIRGNFHEKVYIDGSAYGSKLADGSTDSTREGDADDSQAAFGRRVLTINAHSINSPAVAEEVMLRAFDTLKYDRLQLTCPVHLEFLDIVQPGYVFRTDAAFDALGLALPLVAATPQVWEDQEWIVTRLQIDPYGGMATMDAVQATTVGGLP